MFPVPGIVVIEEPAELNGVVAPKHGKPFVAELFAHQKRRPDYIFRPHKAPEPNRVIDNQTKSQDFEPNFGGEVKEPWSASGHPSYDQGATELARKYGTRP